MLRHRGRNPGARSRRLVRSSFLSGAPQPTEGRRGVQAKDVFLGLLREERIKQRWVASVFVSDRTARSTLRAVEILGEDRCRGSQHDGSAGWITEVLSYPGLALTIQRRIQPRPRRKNAKSLVPGVLRQRGLSPGSVLWLSRGGLLLNRRGGSAERSGNDLQ